ADYKPSTPEELWAILDRGTKRQEEFERRQEDFDRRQAEAIRRQEEADRQREEDWKKIEKMFTENNKKIGGLDNTLGEIVEHLVVPGTEERFKEMGILFDRISPNSRIKQDGKLIAEVDILLENKDSIMAVEVKSKPSTRDVETHRLRLEKLRGYYDRLGDKRALLGAMAGAVFGTDTKKAALDAGFYVMVQSGDAMKMDLPEDFVPRKW
ncbi:MAG: hypothetical protein FWD88_07430, partial [Treponema sp.]|nr:hypothetical protein [Treponema sp.]